MHLVTHSITRAFMKKQVVIDGILHYVCKEKKKITLNVLRMNQPADQLITAEAFL